MGNPYELPDDYELAANTKERKLEWLIEGRVPRSLITLVAGRPGQGKSLFSAWLAAYVTQRGENVLFSNLEDLRGEVYRPRLRVVGAEMKHLHFWTPELGTPEGLATLEAVVRQLQIKLLVIDPLSGHLRRRVMDDRAALAPLTKLCERTKLAIVALHHTKKGVSKNAHPLDAVRGAGDGFMANARFVYIFGRNVDDEDERVLSAAKTNVAEEGSMTFSFEMVETTVAGEKEEIPRLVLADPHSQIPPSKILAHGTGKGGEDTDPTRKAVAADWITTLLMFGEVESSEVKKQAEAAGLKWRTIRRAADGVGVIKTTTKRPGFGTGTISHWSLPDEHPARKVGEAAQKAMDTGLALPKDAQLTVQDVLDAIDKHGTVPEGGSDGPGA